MIYDNNKRYNTLDGYLKSKFGCKVAKVSLNAGFSCPNRDGTKGYGGCIYCSPMASGDFAGNCQKSIREQFDDISAQMAKKWKDAKFMPYFQAGTNTYAPISKLREVYEQALAIKDIVGISITTRPDCISCETLSYLEEISQRTHLSVELGLQSSSDTTARRICRGHTMADFEEGYSRLRRLVPKAEVCVHVIFGLPGESDEDMMNTVKKVADLSPEQVKIHLLHVIKDTPLGDEYLRGDYIPLERERYISLVVEALKLLPPDTVICRLTGDGIAEDLLAPEYSKRKIAILNDIDKLMFATGATQGCNYKKN